MNKTLDIRKAEERGLGKELYTKLRILAQLHKPSDELLKVISEDMFLKPNPKAFLEVTHYLFELLDPAEFKKRFYWPIFDKQSETYYRSSTVQYLNYLNEKHHLNWPQITKYLVVMPGGMKFISFMLEFIEFLSTELTKREEKELSELVGGQKKDEYKSLNIKKCKKNQETYISKCVAYAEKIEFAIDSLKKNTEILENKLGEISETVNIPVNRLKDPNFIDKFEENTWELYLEKCVKSFPRQHSSIVDLNEWIKDFLIGESKKMFNIERLQESQNIIQKMFPDLREHPILKENELNYDAAMKAFNHIWPILQTQLNEIQQGDFRKLEFESNEMEKLCNDFLRLEQRIINGFRISQLDSSEENYHTQNSEEDDRTRNSEDELALNSSLEHKFVNTPPIKFDIDRVKIIKPHLPLLGDFSAQAETFSFANETTLLSPKQSSYKNANSAASNKSRIIDAQKLLQMVKKGSNTLGGQNLSMLTPKSKYREELFDDNEKPKAGRLKLGFTTPITKMSTATHNDQNHTPENSTQPRGNLNNSVEFDPAKDSTSPCGRFECSVKPECADIPKILLNDESILEETMTSYIESF